MLSLSSFAHSGAATTFLAITWTEASLAAIILAIRSYTAFCLQAAPGWDLVLVVFAAILALVAQSLQTTSVLYGTLSSAPLLTPASDSIQAVKYIWVGQAICLSSTVFSRAAIAALIIRIQGPVRPRGTIFLHFVWISYAVLAVIHIPIIFTACDPVTKIWDSSVPGSCDHLRRTTNFCYVIAAYAAFCDTALVTYPTVVFFSMSMSFRKKLGLALLMGGGIFTALIAVTKTLFVNAFEGDPHAAFLICNMSEMWLLIIVGSVPQVRPFFAQKLSKIKAQLCPQSSRTISNKSSIHTSDLGAVQFHREWYRSGTDPIAKKNVISTIESQDRLDSARNSEENMLAPQHSIKVTQRFDVRFDGDHTQP